MSTEIGTILAYPFVDKLSFVLLSIVTWFFGLAKGFGMGGFLLCDGLLLSYSFAAVAKVSNGNLKHYMPDFRDVSDLADPLRLGIAALIVSWAPLFCLGVSVTLPAALGPLAARAPEAVVHAQEQPPPQEPQEAPPEATPEETSPGEEKEEPPPVAKVKPLPGAPIWLWPLLVLAIAWKLVLAPAALAVAALTRSFWQTLNPLVAMGTIVRMGSIHWAAAAIYAGISLLQWVLGLVLGRIPLAGGFLMGFVDAWAWLAIGCTLGLAVFKKARELDLE